MSVAWSLTLRMAIRTSASVSSSAASSSASAGAAPSPSVPSRKPPARPPPSLSAGTGEATAPEERTGACGTRWDCALGEFAPERPGRFCSPATGGWLRASPFPFPWLPGLRGEPAPPCTGAIASRPAVLLGAAPLPGFSSFLEPSEEGLRGTAPALGLSPAPGFASAPFLGLPVLGPTCVSFPRGLPPAVGALGPGPCPGAPRALGMWPSPPALAADGCVGSSVPYSPNSGPCAAQAADATHAQAVEG